MLAPFIGKFGDLFGNDIGIIGSIFFIVLNFQLVQVSALVCKFLVMA